MTNPHGPTHTETVETATGTRETPLERMERERDEARRERDLVMMYAKKLLVGLRHHNTRISPSASVSFTALQNTIDRIEADR